MQSSGTLSEVKEQMKLRKYMQLQILQNFYIIRRFLVNREVFIFNYVHVLLAFFVIYNILNLK